MSDENAKIHIYLGSDHAGFEAKNVLKQYLSDRYHLTDLGCFTPEVCDYPDIAREVSEKVLEVPGSFGILICGSGEGMAMTANKLKGIRAALCTTVELAESSRRHNNANVLALGSRANDIPTIKLIADKFLSTDFDSSEERHVRRVNKIDPQD